MKNDSQIKIFLVDDDALFLKLLEFEYLQQEGFFIEAYSTGELCIENLPHNPDVVVLDYHLDGIDKNAMNGMETLDKIKAYNPNIPVVILSSQDKIEVAIKCVDHQAIDYVVKNESSFMHLQNIITAIFNYKKMERELHHLTSSI